MRVPQTKGGRPGTNTHMYMGFVNWVSSTGSTVRVSSQASHSPRLSRLPISTKEGNAACARKGERDYPEATPRLPRGSPSLTKEGNAACARQVCRKVTTRETRDQRRISTWYQNLRVLSAHPFIPIAALHFAGSLSAARFCCSLADHNLFNKTHPVRAPEHL